MIYYIVPRTSDKEDERKVREKEEKDKAVVRRKTRRRLPPWKKR